MKSVSLAVVLAASSSIAEAQRSQELTRGEIRVVVPAQGVVVTDDLLRLKSSIEGRVEAVSSSTGVWAGPEAPLGVLLDQDLAALMDTRQTTPSEVLQERWRKIYRPAEIRCPADCFILHAYAKPKRWVQPGALLFEVAKTLRLEGAVDPGDLRWLEAGQLLEYWPVGNPSRRETVTLEAVRPALRAPLSRRRYLDPGTRWEGRIIALVKKDVLKAPTGALIRYEDSVYLPLRVSTGITTKEWTEITSGAEPGRPLLSLDPKELGAARQHAPDPPPRARPVIEESPYDRPSQESDE